MRSYPVKENPIGSVVNEILQYKQTNKQIDIVLLCFIDYLFLKLKFLVSVVTFQDLIKVPINLS